MKNRFILTLTIALVISAAMAWAMYAAVSKGLANTLKDNQGKLNYILKGKQGHDVLFMGSSRVFVQINPVIFDSVAGTNSYNAGTDGVRIAEIEVLIKDYIAHHPLPEYLVLSIDETTLKNSSIWDYPRWFPYMHEGHIRALSRYQHEMKLAQYLPPVALTYYDDPKKSLGLQGLVRQGELAYKDTKGFNPLAVAEVANLQPADSITYYYDEQGIATFSTILSLCKAHNIQPIIVVPPLYTLNADTSKTHNEFIQLVRTHATKVDRNIPVFDYSSDRTFFNRNLYRDGSHLNEVGGAIYTRKIAADYIRFVTAKDSVQVN